MRTCRTLSRVTWIGRLRRGSRRQQNLSGVRQRRTTCLAFRRKMTAIPEAALPGRRGEISDRKSRVSENPTVRRFQITIRVADFERSATQRRPFTTSSKSSPTGGRYLSVRMVKNHGNNGSCGTCHYNAVRLKRNWSSCGLSRPTMRRLACAFDCESGIDHAS